MDKKPRSPIVAERDDMIGRTTSDKRADQANSKTSATSRAGANGLSGSMRWLVLLTFFGLIGAGFFGWSEYQQLSTKHETLQARFELLESRLSSTDESVTQSGAAMQINISKHSDELKKHWSEIRKLWGVTNDINKGKIEKNQKDISFLASKRQALETAVAKDSKSLKALSGNYLGISADLDAANENMRNYADGLNRLNNSLSRIDRELKSNAEAVESMEAFRRQINQKIYALEQSAPAPATLTN